MPQTAQPFALPDELEPDLARVDAYWRGLLRGNANMPFWDDLNLTELASLSDQLMLIDVKSRPERFRFSEAGKDIAGGQRTALSGEFADMLELEPPLDFFVAQASVTVESEARTYFAKSPVAGEPGQGYARLLLPMWGDGSISMILGAVAPLR